MRSLRPRGNPADLVAGVVLATFAVSGLLKLSDINAFIAALQKWVVFQGNAVTAIGLSVSSFELSLGVFWFS